MVPWVVEQKTRERNKEADLIEAHASWAPWDHGYLEGRRRDGAILVQQRCQWSAARAEVTSVLRLHGATNAYLSMKHEVAKQAINEMVLEKRRQGALRPAHVLGSGDGWRKGGHHRCASKVRHMDRRLLQFAHLRAGNVLSFSSRIDSEEKRKLHALGVEKCPITAQGIWLGMTGYVDNCARHLLGAGACESDRWRPSQATQQTGFTDKVAFRPWRKARRKKPKKVEQHGATRGGAEWGTNKKRKQGFLGRPGHGRGGRECAGRTRAGGWPRKRSHCHGRPVSGLQRSGAGGAHGGGVGGGAHGGGRGPLGRPGHGRGGRKSARRTRVGVRPCRRNRHARCCQRNGKI